MTFRLYRLLHYEYGLFGGGGLENKARTPLPSANAYEPELPPKVGCQLLFLISLHICRFTQAVTNTQAIGPLVFLI